MIGYPLGSAGSFSATMEDMDGASLCSDEDEYPVPPGLAASRRRAVVSELTGVPNYLLSVSMRQQALYRATQAGVRGRRAGIYRPDQRASAISALTMFGSNTCVAGHNGSSMPPGGSAPSAPTGHGPDSRTSEELLATPPTANPQAAEVPSQRYAASRLQTADHTAKPAHASGSNGGLPGAGLKEAAKGNTALHDQPIPGTAATSQPQPHPPPLAAQPVPPAASGVPEPKTPEQAAMTTDVPTGSIPSSASCSQRQPGSGPHPSSSDSAAAAPARAARDLTQDDDAWHRLAAGTRACNAACRATADLHQHAAADAHAGNLKGKLLSKKAVELSVRTNVALGELASLVGMLPVQRLVLRLLETGRPHRALKRGGAAGAAAGVRVAGAAAAATVVEREEFSLLPRKGVGVQQGAHDATWTSRAVALLSAHFLLSCAAGAGGAALPPHKAPPTPVVDHQTGGGALHHHSECALLLADSLLVHCGLPALPLQELAVLTRALYDLWIFLASDADSVVSLPAGAPASVGSLQLLVRIVRHCSSAVTEALDTLTRENYRVVASWLRAQEDYQRLLQQAHQWPRTPAPQPPPEVLIQLSHMDSWQLEDLVVTVISRHGVAVREAAKRAKEGAPKKLTQRFRTAYKEHLKLAQVEKEGLEFILRTTEAAAKQQQQQQGTRAGKEEQPQPQPQRRDGGDSGVSLELAQGAQELYERLSRFGLGVLKCLPHLVAWDAEAEAELASSRSGCSGGGSGESLVVGWGIARASGWVVCSAGGNSRSPAGALCSLGSSGGDCSAGDAKRCKGGRSGSGGGGGSSEDQGCTGNASGDGDVGDTAGREGGSGLAAQVARVARAVLEAALDGVQTRLSVLGDAGLHQVVAHAANVGWLRQAAQPHTAAAAAAAAASAAATTAGGSAAVATTLGDGPILLRFEPLPLSLSTQQPSATTTRPVPPGPAHASGAAGSSSNGSGGDPSSSSTRGSGCCMSLSSGHCTAGDTGAQRAPGEECMAAVEVTLVPADVAAGQRIRGLWRYALETRQRRRRRVVEAADRSASSSPSSCVFEAPISGCWQPIADRSGGNSAEPPRGGLGRTGREAHGGAGRQGDNGQDGGGRSGKEEDGSSREAFQQHLALLHSCLSAFGCARVVCRGRAALRAAVQLIAQAHLDTLQPCNTDAAEAASAGGSPSPSSGGLEVLPFVSCRPSYQVRLQEARDRILRACCCDYGATAPEAAGQGVELQGGARWALSEGWQAWRRLALNRESCRLLGLVEEEGRDVDSSSGSGNSGKQRSWRPYGNEEYGTEAVVTLVVVRQRASAT
ncbi:hypothetical protein Agub_g1234 [Astrephomene gubernaculifera]|uniref:Uncharacterized protein n=1 Tax=Astrephomene gubernaculifera TaxID=47775 RepID=A0AAD3DF29_9CHLO|nr:hypothetical protein Agub_g1234 [Astrephomene gubernaculifera]